MPPASIRISQPRLLKESVKTLRKLRLPLSSSSPITIAPYPSTRSSYIPRKVGRSIPPLLVPKSTQPAKTLALLRKLATSSPGPFFAAGKAGEMNAALFAAACLAPTHPKIRRALHLFRSRQTQSVPLHP